MVQQLLDWLYLIGLPGLFLAMFLEGSSLPFPGIIIVFSYGYLYSPGYQETAILAVGMSVIYSLASLIPYFLGMRLEGYFSSRFEKGLKKRLQKGQVLFTRYGIWSIAFSRPFGVGNYISYVAGMSKVELFKYVTLTFIGIYPWSYVMLILGDYFKGNYEAFKNFFSSYSIYGYGAMLAIIMVLIIVIKKRNKGKKRLNNY